MEGEVYVSGDKRNQKTQAITQIKKHLEIRLNHSEKEFDDLMEQRLQYLPGEIWPEAYLIQEALNAENKECPMSYYLKAVIGARTNDATAVIENLRKACSLDGSFKQLAATDMEFAKFFENNDFIAITK